MKWGLHCYSKATEERASKALSPQSLRLSCSPPPSASLTLPPSLFFLLFFLSLSPLPVSQTEGQNHAGPPGTIQAVLLTSGLYSVPYFKQLFKKNNNECPLFLIEC